MDIRGCTGLNKNLSNSPSLINFGPISYKASKQNPEIPIEINVIPYNNNISLKFQPAKFSVF